MSLRSRFTLYFTLLVVAVLSAATFAFYYSQRTEMTRQLRIQHKQALLSLAKVCQEALLVREDIALLNYLRDIARKEDIQTADVVGNDGLWLAHPDPSKIGLPATTALRGPYVYTVPILVSGRVMGQARLAYDADRIRRQLRSNLSQNVGQFISSIVLGSLFLGILMAWALAYGLTQPIRRLVAGARHIGEGKLDYRINVRRKDELGRLAEEFNQMAKRLNELDQMKQEFMHSITHDLRNPLTAIIGYAQLMLENKNSLPQMYGRSLELMLKSAQQLNEMISTILDLAKLEAGMMKLNAQDENLARLMQDVHQMFWAPAQTKKIDLKLALSVTQAPVSIDVFMIKRVIQNLVSNALKFTPAQGTISLELTKQGGYFLCVVRDTGPGIPPEHMKGMFQKFNQVPGIKGDRRGTGLGLAICKSTIEAHGGRVGVESAVGRGSVFFFYLPAKA